MHEIVVDRPLLVTDFDGTLTRRQFFQLVRTRLTPPATPDYWVDYRAGQITHFEALKACFADAEGGEEALINLTHDMQLESNLAEKVSSLQSAGWDVVVVSAGCSWYIERLLAEARVELHVFTNSGRIVGGQLIMEPPADGRFRSRETGIDKAEVVRSFQENGRRVAFAGDGYPDLEAALLVPEYFRFARSDLAEALQDCNERFWPFDTWADVVSQLLGAKS